MYALQHFRNITGSISKAEWDRKGVTGKVLYVGGDATWRVTVFEMGNAIMEAIGVGGS